MDASARRRFQAAVALILSVFVLAPSAAADGSLNRTASDGDPALQTAVDDAIRIRTTLGMRRDSEYVLASPTNSTAFPDDPLGVPMTPPEAAEVLRRLDVQDRIDPVAGRAEGSLRSYAGMFMDQTNGGLPVLLLTDTSAGNNIRARAPAGLDVGIREVARSLTELRAVKDETSNDRASLREAGYPLIEVSIDIARNSVVVGLEKADVGVAEVAAMRDRYGPGALVEATKEGSHDACPDSNCMPTRGGIGMLSGTKHNPCTVGFIVKILAHPTLSTPRHGLLTAGHCFRLDGASGIGVTWYHELGDSTTKVGVSQNETFTDEGSADAGHLTALNLPAAKNLIVRPTGEIRNITSAPGSSAQNQGDYVCRLGRTSGRTCGNITLTDRRRWSTVSGITRDLNHRPVVDFDSLGGDSGGPYYAPVGTNDAKAYGVHIHSLDPSDHEGWYSTVWWSNTQLGSEFGIVISPCIQASC